MVQAEHALSTSGTERLTQSGEFSIVHGENDRFCRRDPHESLAAD